MTVATLVVVTGLARPESGQFNTAGLQEATTPGGDLGFQTDLYTGRFSYTIPIERPPARQNSGPSVGVRYSSSSGNGILGMGWTVGVGCIERDTRRGVPATWLDPEQDPPSQKTYDDERGFIVNFGGVSSPLILIQEDVTSPGEPQVVYDLYRSELERDFHEFQFIRQSPGHPSPLPGSWRVVTISGEVHEFGGGGWHLRDLSFNAGPKPGGDIFRWPITKTTDANGNLTWYTYTTFGSPKLYPDRIHYNGNNQIDPASFRYTVEFQYEPTDRDDVVIDYSPGFRVETKRRLARIDVKYCPNSSLAACDENHIRSYTFGYEYSPSTGRSRLTAVGHVAPNGQALPQMTFDYHDMSWTFAPSTTWATWTDRGQGNEWYHSSTRSRQPHGVLTTNVELRDMDRDGRLDRVMTEHSSTTFPKYYVYPNDGDDFATVDGSTAPFSKQLSFTPLENTLNWHSLGQTDLDEGSVRALLVDINGDGFPDRVDGPFNPPGTTTGGVPTRFGYNLFDPTCPAGTWVGTGYVLRNSLTCGGPITNYVGSGFWFDHVGPIEIPGSSQNPVAPNEWAYPISSQNHVDHSYTHALLIDMNGDGLVDRLRAQHASDPVRPPHQGSFTDYDRFYIQWHTGEITGADDVTFTDATEWPNLQYPTVASQDEPEFRNLVHVQNGDTAVGMYDLNGDGLPDRCVRDPVDHSHIYVQYNTGLGFDDIELFGGDVHGQLQSIGTGAGYGMLVGRDEHTEDDNPGPRVETYLLLADINGDGLLDRVQRPQPPAAFNKFHVQVNTGNGWKQQLIPMTGVEDQFGEQSAQWGSIVASDDQFDTYVDLVDMNGDGLPDRVMSDRLDVTAGLKVQLNEGPHPDLLANAYNGIGGTVGVTYRSSIEYDNRDGPWTTTSQKYNETLGMLPYSVNTVASVTTGDGLGNSNTISYDYKGGFFDTVTREFRGFHRVEETNTHGARTVTYFHQGGGYDGVDVNEGIDERPYAGFPFLVERYGWDGETGTYVKRSQTRNRILAIILDFQNSPSWRYPFVYRTIQEDFAGLQSRLRATTYQYEWINKTGNLLSQHDHGEIDGYDVNLSVTDTNLDDDVVTCYEYEDLPMPGGAPTIKDRPRRITMGVPTGSNDPCPTTVLADISFAYYEQGAGPGRAGNVSARSEYLETAGVLLVESFDYDPYGNVTHYTDRTGLVTTTAYDLADHTFPTTRSTGGFVTSFVPDPLSARIKSVTDQKGMTLELVYDEFFRLTETRISPTAFGPPTLWQQRYDYQCDGAGVVGNTPMTGNRVRHRVNDGIDPVNGYETLTYYDGLARPVQVRREADTSGSYRVTDTEYDGRGLVVFEAAPYLSAGSAFTGFTMTPEGRLPRTLVGMQTFYDSHGRPAAVLPTPNGGDAGSPTAAQLITYEEGTNPWADVVTDAEGRTIITRTDAYGRTEEIIEDPGGIDAHTTFVYDRLGNITEVTDDAGNVTTCTYNRLGQRTSIDDPDMGFWTYTFDANGRAFEEIDAKNQRRRNVYDSLNRIRFVKVYDDQGVERPELQTEYRYDVNPDADHTVFAGQLAEVIDAEGYERYSYDVRGRVLKTTRHIAETNTTSSVEFTYDDGNHIRDITYPGGVASVRCTYTDAGRLDTIESLSGTGGSIVLYEAAGFEPSGQLSGITYGNGATSSFTYYPNSRRVESISTNSGGLLQSLTYRYDAVGNTKRIIDGRFATGPRSGSMQNITYDKLHRLVEYTRPGGVRTTFAYDSIGNMRRNGERTPPSRQYQSAGLSGTATPIGRGSGGGGPSSGGGPQATQVSLQTGSRYGYHDPSGKPHAVTHVDGRLVYAYDANGCMTTRGEQTLTYNALNQLTRVQDASQIVDFGYAHDGSRLWKRNGPDTTVWAGSYYEERNGQPLCHVIADGRRICSFEPGAGADMAYYHADHLGSTNVVTDRTGNEVGHYVYKAFGSDSSSIDSGGIDITRRFTDQLFDAEVGLYFYNARYFDPVLGRFIQPDPVLPTMSNPQALNRYSYALNNPLRFVDPSGNFTIGGLFWAALFAGIIGGINAEIAGGDFEDGFVRGAVQGAVAYTVGEFSIGVKIQKYAGILKNASQYLGYVDLGDDVNEIVSETGRYAGGVESYLETPNLQIDASQFIANTLGTGHAFYAPLSYAASQITSDFGAYLQRTVDGTAGDVSDAQAIARWKASADGGSGDRPFSFTKDFGRLVNSVDNFFNAPTTGDLSMRFDNVKNAFDPFSEAYDRLEDAFDQGKSLFEYTQRLQDPWVPASTPRPRSAIGAFQQPTQRPFNVTNLGGHAAETRKRRPNPLRETPESGAQQ